MTETINNTAGKKFLNLICGFLSTGNSNSTKYISDSLGVENHKIKRNERGSKFLIPKNNNLGYIAINPDLSENDADSPVSYLGFSGPDLNLKLEYLIKVFPNVELVENTYDDGVQLFFHPVNEKFDFTAVSCQISKNARDISELRSFDINQITFLFKLKKVKTRAGYSME